MLGELGRAVEELRAQVADLRRRLGRNSGNSSMPPSADDLPGKVSRERAARGKGSGRRRGKRPGAAGASMAWDEPDEVADHRPEGACGCGAGLAGAADLGVARSFQQLEVPLITARRIQHDLRQVRCRCGRLHVAARPEGVPDSAVSTGLNLRALAVYLVVYQHVPVERCQRLIADVTGAQVWAGFVHSCLARAAGLIADVVRLIRTLITAAHVAGFDETTLRSGPAGQKRYVLAAVTERYSLFFLGRRALESFREFGILPEFGGVVVSDRYANSQRALAGLIRGWHAGRDAGQRQIPPGIRDPLMREFRHAVLAGLSDVRRVPGPKSSTAQHPGRDLLEFCRDRQDDVTRFCSGTRIWPTNNISGRGVRPVKTQQKISGRLTSEDATQHRLDIRSYTDTTRKHGCNVMDILRTVMSGAPWSPPAPALA